jgi:two-component system response regulator YesN
VYGGVTIIYRLLIVDDEEIIVNGLYEIFSSIKTLDLDVYKAYSGAEAIEWLDRTRFDIVLTDIKMPEIDGIQLLDEIIKNWPQCRVIFLTGHDEFEYVYKAIQYKNVSYLLKTEDPEMVVNEVADTIKDIEKEIKIEDLIHRAKEQMDMVQDLFQKDYLIHLLHKDTSLEISESQFERLSIPLYREKPVILLLGDVDTPEDLSYWNKMQYYNSVRFLLNQNLNTHVRNVNVMDDDYKFILFMQPNELFMENQPSEDIYQRAVSFLKGTLEVIQAICRESLNASISFVLDGDPCPWENIAHRYYSLSQLLRRRSYCGAEGQLADNEFIHIYHAEASAEARDSIEDDNTYMVVYQKKLDAFKQYLEAGQKKKYFKALSELVLPLKGGVHDNNTAILAYYKIAICLLSYINRTQIADKL